MLQLQKVSWHPDRASRRLIPTLLGHHFLFFCLHGFSLAVAYFALARLPQPPVIQFCSGTSFSPDGPESADQNKWKSLLKICIVCSIIANNMHLLVCFFSHAIQTSFQNKFSIKTILLLVTSNNNFQAQREKELLTTFLDFSLPSHSSKKRMSWRGPSCQGNPFMNAHAFTSVESDSPDNNVQTSLGKRCETVTDPITSIWQMSRVFLCSSIFRRKAQKVLVKICL